MTNKITKTLVILVFTMNATSCSKDTKYAVDIDGTLKEFRCSNFEATEALKDNMLNQHASETIINQITYTFRDCLDKTISGDYESLLTLTRLYPIMYLQPLPIFPNQYVDNLSTWKRSAKFRQELNPHVSLKNSLESTFKSEFGMSLKSFSKEIFKPHFDKISAGKIIPLTPHLRYRLYDDFTLGHVNTKKGIKRVVSFNFVNLNDKISVSFGQVSITDEITLKNGKILSPQVGKRFLAIQSIIINLHSEALAELHTDMKIVYSGLNGYRPTHFIPDGHPSFNDDNNNLERAIRLAEAFKLEHMNNSRQSQSHQSHTGIVSLRTSTHSIKKIGENILNENYDGFNESKNHFGEYHIFEIPSTYPVHSYFLFNINNQIIPIPLTLTNSSTSIDTNRRIDNWYEADINVKSDHNAQYTLLSKVRMNTGNWSALVRRIGPSGKSYTLREINCDNGYQRYVAEREVDENYNPNYAIGEMAKPIPESISGVITKFVCNMKQDNGGYIDKSTGPIVITVE